MSKYSVRIIDSSGQPPRCYGYDSLEEAMDAARAFRRGILRSGCVEVYRGDCRSDDDFRCIGYYRGDDIESWCEVD